MAFVRIQNSIYRDSEIIRVHGIEKDKRIMVYFEDTSQWNNVGVAIYQYSSVESVQNELYSIEHQLRNK